MLVVVLECIIGIFIKKVCCCCEVRFCWLLRVCKSRFDCVVDGVEGLNCCSLGLGLDGWIMCVCGGFWGECEEMGRFVNKEDDEVDDLI